MRSESRETEQARVAVATGDGVVVTEHFGYATQFQIWDVAGPAPRLLETRRNLPACGAERPASSQRDPMDASVGLVADCRAVVVARIGECGVNRLAALGILAFETEDRVDMALRELFDSGILQQRDHA